MNPRLLGAVACACILSNSACGGARRTPEYSNGTVPTSNTNHTRATDTAANDASEAVVAEAAPQLPPAPVQPLDYEVVTVPLPGKVSSVPSIHGMGPHDVWLLLEVPTKLEDHSTYHLAHYGGHQIRILHRNLCMSPDEVESGNPMKFFTLVRATQNRVTFYGHAGGGMAFAEIGYLEQARRLVCPDETGLDSENFLAEYDFGAYFESEGQVWQASPTPNHSVAFRAIPQGADPDELVGDPVAGFHPLVLPNARHGWMTVTSDDAVHLAEWTGVRWRARADALPAEATAADLLAVEYAGSVEWAITPKALLRHNGEAFELLSGPLDFKATHLLAAQWAAVGQERNG